MNKTALCLMMLRVLKSRKIIKKNEIAEILETNPRNISEFKKELEVAGYDIEVKNGPDGGYFLKEKSLLIIPDLTKSEISSLQEVYAYLKSTDITLQKEAQNALEKILAVSLIDDFKDDIYSSGRKLSIDRNILQNYYEIIKLAILKKKRLKVSYKAKNKTINTWMIHPYGMFLYQGMWYLVCYRENDHEITLKLNRITSLEETNVPFSKPSDFNINKYRNEYGISIKGNNHLVARIKKRYYISEYIYGENQNITTLDDETILLEVDFPNMMSLKSFVMELGSDCYIIEPNNIKEEIIKETKELLEQYK